MTGQGYPDFVRNDQQIGAPLVNVSNVQATPSKVYGPFNVGVWAALSLYLTTNNTPQKYTLTLDWFADEAMTQPSGTMAWTASNDANIGDQAVNMGPWVLITVACTAGAGSAGFSLRATPTSVVSYRQRSIPNGYLLHIPITTLAPGASVVAYAAQVCAGPAYWFVSDGDNIDMLAVLWAYDLSQTDGNIDEVYATTSPFVIPGGRNVILPPSTMAIAITNNHPTTTGHFWAWLIPQT